MFCKRFLRAQAQHEKSPVPSLLKKKDNADMWLLDNLLDCCKYFQSSGGKKSSQSQAADTEAAAAVAIGSVDNKMVTLLLNNQEQCSTSRSLESAQQDGIYHIG